MGTKRIASGTISVALSALLGWSILAGVGHLRTQMILALGIALGSLFTVFGGLPSWILGYSGGSITDDDDPSNISPRVYLPILLGAILVASIAFCVVVFVM